MRYGFEDQDNASVISVRGELTADNTEELRRACREYLDGVARDVVLDMTHITMIDSAGLELLLWLSDVQAVGERRLRLVRPCPTVRRVLAITRLDRHFDVEESIASAMRSLRAA